MNKKIIFFLIIVIVLAFTFLFAGCEKRESFIIDFPNADEQVGYTLLFSGVYTNFDEDANKYTISEGEDVNFEIRGEEGYTLKNMVVKNNDDVMEFTDLSFDDLKIYKFTIKTISKACTITVSGVEELVFDVRMDYARYKENADDTEGTVFDEYDSRVFMIKHGDDIYSDLDAAISGINAKNLQLNYGDIFEIWIGEYYPLYYEPGSFYLYNGNEEFDGIFGIKKGNSYETQISVPNTTFYSPLRDDNNNYIMQQNMYKFEIEAKEDLNLYFNTMELNKVEYSIIYENNEVYDVVYNDYYIVYDETFSFTIDKLLLEDHPNMYDDMRVYINGEDVTSRMDGDTYECTQNRTPSSYNEGNHNNFRNYKITVSGIDLTQNESEETKIKVNPNEYIDYVKYRTDRVDKPYYYEDGEYYFIKDDEYIEVFFRNSLVYDYSDMVIDINGIEITPDDREVGDISLIDFEEDGRSYWAIKFNGNYQNSYEIDISGIVKNKFTYTIKNDLSSEIDLYLKVGDFDSELITSTKTLTMEDGDSVIITLISKDDQGDISDYVFIGTENAAISGGGSSGVEGNVTRKHIEIQVNAERDNQGRNISIGKE